MYHTTIISSNVIEHEAITIEMKQRLGLKKRVIKDYYPCWIGSKSPMTNRLEQLSSNSKQSYSIAQYVLGTAVLLLSCLY